jgi:hypothetical protein
MGSPKVSLPTLMTLPVFVIILSYSIFSKVISYLLMSRQNCKCLMVNCLVFLLKIPSCTQDLLYINAIDLTLNRFCQNRGQGFSMGGKPKPCKLVSSMYLAHIVTQTMCYLLHTVQITKYKVRIFSHCYFTRLNLKKMGPL